MRLISLLLLCIVQISCSRYVHSIQTDGSNTPPTYPDQARMVVWGTTPSVIEAANTWLQKRGIVVIERARLEQILNEQRERLVHTREQETDLLKVGKLAEATALVFVEGKVLEGRHGYASVSVRAVDVEQGRSALERECSADWHLGLCGPRLGWAHL